MPEYKSIPIRAVTEKAFRELEYLGLAFEDIEKLLNESYDCSKSKRKRTVQEKCIKYNGKTLKIVIELMTSRTQFEKYWRIRHVSFV